MEWFKTVPFSDVVLWDVKRYSFEKIKSQYPIVKLGLHIQEESHKVKLANFPDDEFGILGVSNKVGIFDAYSKKGANINQSYKKMEEGWLAYNPYRVNVGSIGLRTEEHENEYISPAYVVFSCKETLLPDFLFKLFKTNRFNTVINASTTGSVRQNLTIDILKSLDIPLPPVDIQQKMLNEYYFKERNAKNLLNNSKTVESDIEEFILDSLGLKIPPPKTKSKKLQFTSFKSIDRWDILSSDLRIQNFLSESKFNLKTIGTAFNFVNRSWKKNQHNEEYFNYIELGGIDPILGISDVTEVLVSEAASRATQTVSKNDLIIGTTRPYLKRFAIVPDEYSNHVCSSGFSIIESSTDYNLIYLKEYLMSFFGIEQLKNRMTGGSYPAITSSELREIKIPIPNIEIQNSIALKLTELRNRMISNINSSQSLLNNAICDFEKNVLEL
jgi:restriction endonuclease S subunit